MEKLKVLIVEDEQIIASDLQDLLQEYGYEVSAIARSYQEGLYFLEKCSPDIALIDIVLHRTEAPKSDALDGIHLAEKIRDQYQIPFIYISSHTDPQTLQRAKATLPNAYLVKPFHNEQVFAAMETALFSFAHQEQADQVEEEANPTSGSLPPPVKRCVDYIESNSIEAISLQELARQNQMNKFHLARLFKKHVGQSPYQYLLKCRIDQACVLLRESEESIFQIALQVGYENHSNFNKTFKKFIGLSPLQYRQKNR